MFMIVEEYKVKKMNLKIYKSN